MCCRRKHNVAISANLMLKVSLKHHPVRFFLLATGAIVLFAAYGIRICDRSRPMASTDIGESDTNALDVLWLVSTSLLRGT